MRQVAPKLTAPPFISLFFVDIIVLPYGNAMFFGKNLNRNLTKLEKLASIGANLVVIISAIIASITYAANTTHKLSVYRDTRFSQQWTNDPHKCSSCFPLKDNEYPIDLDIKVVDGQVDGIINLSKAPIKLAKNLNKRQRTIMQGFLDIELSNQLVGGNLFMRQGNVEVYTFRDGYKKLVANAHIKLDGNILVWNTTGQSGSLIPDKIKFYPVVQISSPDEISDVYTNSK